MGFGDKSKKEKQGEKSALADVKKGAAVEDSSWGETDKGAKKKLDRASAQADKDAEALRKKQEKKELEAAEDAEVGKTAAAAEAKKKKPAASGKLTQAQVQANLALLNAAPGNKKTVKAKQTEDSEAPEITENTNRQTDVIATSVEGALKHLEINTAADKKMTYKQFEQDMLDRVKEENPGLKSAQVKERVFKLWERSPMNPKNLRA